MKLDRRLSMRHAFLCLLALGATMAVHAQNIPVQQFGPRIGIRGTLTAVSDDLINVHTNQGDDVSVKIGKSTQVRAVTLARISDIRAGSYIGTAAIPQPDGTQKALEVHVFPPAMAGAGDGHRAFDLVPNSTMTNGTVGDLVVANGRTLTLKYKDGEKKIFVPEDVPIVNLLPGDKSLLKVGVKVVMFATRDADGDLSAAFISAGKDGVTPPM
jgi:hypothetical protein